jgi:Tfp pilus assembly protein PilO
MKNYLRNHRREWIAAVVLVAAAVAVELTMIMPKRQATSKLRARLKTVKAQVEQGTSALDEFVELAGEDQSTPDFIIGPEAEILPRLLESIAALGKKHNLEILSLKPQKIDLVELPVDDQYGYQAETKRLYIVMRVKATYRDLGDYFEELETIPILVAVRGLKLKKENEASPLLLADFTIETYSIKAYEKKKN